MSKSWVPIAAMLFLLVVPFFGGKPSQQEARRYWMTVYTAEVPAGAFETEGLHTFRYIFKWTSPKAGELVGEPRQVETSARAPIQEGSVLLRPSGPQALTAGDEQWICREIKKGNPAQPMRVMVAWVADQRMTEAQIGEHIGSMQAWVQLEDGRELPLEQHEISPNWDALWNCLPWAGQPGALPTPETEPGTQPEGPLAFLVPFRLVMVLPL